MNTVRAVIFVISVSFLVFACSEPTQDERRDKRFSEMYDKAIKNEDYCEAYKVASLFPHADNGQTSQLTMMRHMEKWNKNIEESAIACKKKLWPKIQASIRSNLDDLNKYRTLQNISATYLGESLRLDSVQRACVVDLEINNTSDFDIVGFQGELDGDVNRKRVNYESKGYRDIILSGGGVYRTPDGFVAIPSGAKKTSSSCDFYVYELMARKGNSDVRARIKSVQLDDKKTVVLSELINNIYELERQLSLGYESVDLPKPKSIYQD